MIESGSTPLVPGPEGDTLLTPPETTGRFIVVFAEGTDGPASILRDAAGMTEVATARELREEEAPDDTAQTTDTVFDELGIAVVSADPEQIGALQTSAESTGTAGAVGLAGAGPPRAATTRVRPRLPRRRRRPGRRLGASSGPATTRWPQAAV